MFFQLVDADNPCRQYRFSAIGFMFHPKADGFVGVLSPGVFLAKQCHKIIFRYSNLLALNGIVAGIVDILQYLVVTNGSPFHNEKVECLVGDVGHFDWYRYLGIE